MHILLAVALLAALVGCERGQQPAPKTEPSSAQLGDKANESGASRGPTGADDTKHDHVWRGQVEALEKARAAAAQAEQAPAHRSDTQ